uniref:Uncharacterized protein n=1 Tax=Setaria italica TaxID=4555 RepID=K4AH05_SETIT
MESFTCVIWLDLWINFWETISLRLISTGNNRREELTCRTASGSVRGLPRTARSWQLLLPRKSKSCILEPFQRRPEPFDLGQTQNRQLRDEPRRNATNPPPPAAS